MATLKKVTRNPSLSAKIQTAPGAGMAAIFGALADTLGNAVDYYMPGAIEEMQRRGADEGYAAAGGGSTFPSMTAAPSGPVDPNSMIGDDTMKALVRTGLISRGLPEHVADGIMMNMADESAFNLSAVGDNGNAFGLVQWNGPRKAALEQFAAKRGSSPADLDTQLDFLVQELEGPERGAYDSLLRTGSASEAAVAFLNDFERPAETHRSRREAKYSSGSTVVSTSDQNLGMIGGVKPDGGVYQSLDGSGTAHASNPEYRDYSQLFREYRFDPPDETWVAVGKRDGKTLYAAPDYARDESGNYLSVSAADAQRLAQERGTVIPTRGEVKVLYSKAEHIPMPTQPIGETGGTGDSAAYTAAIGEVPPGKAVVHGKEFFSSSGQASPPAQNAPASQNAPQRPSAPAQATGGIRQPKLYSPYSGPLLRAHNAAAEAAFNAEVLNRAEVDFQSLRNNFLLDPGGFGQAARSYVDEIVSKAPAQFRRGLRETLNGQIASTQTSILGAQQADTRQRAANSTGALADRLSNQYAEALAAGDADGAMKARSELEQVLRTRENLPGLSWTREQSENVLLKAMDVADTIRAKAQDDFVKEAKATLSDAIDVYKAGMEFSDEGWMSDPAYQQADPELFEDAMEWRAVRDAANVLRALPPSVMTQQAATLLNTPAEDDNDAAIAVKFNEMALANKSAWNADPIQQAFDVMPPDQKPPEIDMPVDGDVGKFVNSLKLRREYANTLVGDGYVRDVAFLSGGETEAFSALFGDDAPAELKAGFASALVQGFGDDAIKVFGVLDVDPVTAYAGKMLAVGANGKLVKQAMAGAELLASGAVSVPSEANFRETIGDTMSAAFAGTPGAEQAQAEILPFARALYAASVGNDASASNQSVAMKAAVQRAMGRGKDNKERTTGGIQTILGFETILPIDVAGDLVNEAMSLAFTDVPIPIEGNALERFSALGAALLGQAEKTPWSEAYEDAWSRASRRPGHPGIDGYEGSVPIWNGKPLDPSVVGETLRLVPDGGNYYRMEIVTGEEAADVQDSRGMVYRFDLKSFVESMQ